MSELRTPRLLLRRWRESDRAPFAAMNADPAVMEHFPSPMTRAESDAFARRIEAAFEEQGFGLWAVEVSASGEFAGFTGLAPVRFEAPFAPAVEIGWRLAVPAWGHGYATEAATAALSFAFDELQCPEVVAFTAVENERSIQVMRRLGMTRDPVDDFDHPSVADGSLRRQVLYRMAAERWRDP